MTRIEPSHRVAQRALLAISAILDEAGALCERITNDYGEDLLVHTQLENVADTFRIFVQVKGAALKRNAPGTYSLRLDVSHLQRWVSQVEPVLVCVGLQAKKGVCILSGTAILTLEAGYDGREDNDGSSGP